jgi:hypothetical protein
MVWVPFPLETMRTALQWSCRSSQSAIVIFVMIVNRPQEVAEGDVRDARPVPPRYYVRGAEVNSLVDPDIDHIVSHIRKALICSRLADEGAKH